MTWSLMADVAIGLVAPDSGQVCFEGQCWESRPPEAHADARARIRRVFSHKGWISNLDIDENMILARYHHGDANEEELREACKAVADEIGLSVLSGRPEAFHTRQLQPLQWIRALVGESDLLVVGHRRELINSDCGTLLAKALNRRIESGLSVLWLGSDLPDVLRGVPDPWLYAKLGPSGISFREMT